MKKIRSLVLLFVALVAMNLGVFAQSLELVLNFSSASSDRDVNIETMDSNGDITVYGQTIDIQTYDMWSWSISSVQSNSKSQTTSFDGNQLVYSADSKGVDVIYNELRDDLNSVSIQNIALYDDTVIVVLYCDYITGEDGLEVISIAIDQEGNGEVFSTVNISAIPGSVSFLKGEEKLFMEWKDVSGQQYLGRFYLSSFASWSYLGDEKEFHKLEASEYDKIVAICDNSGSGGAPDSKYVYIYNLECTFIDLEFLGEKEDGESNLNGIVVEDVLYYSYALDVAGSYVVHLGTYNLETGEELWPSGNAPMSDPGDYGFKTYFHNNRIFIVCGNEVSVHNATTGVYENNVLINPVTNPPCDSYNPSLGFLGDRIFHFAMNDWDPGTITSLCELNIDGSLLQTHYNTPNGGFDYYNYNGVIINGENIFLYGEYFDWQNVDHWGGFIKMFETTEAQTYTVTFNVLDDDSWEAVEGAIVEIQEYQHDMLVTDINGQTTIQLEDGMYEYHVSADGYNDEIGLIMVDGGEITESIYLDEIVGIYDIEASISIYPNPSSDFIIIDGANYENIKIYNNLGQIVLEIQKYNGQQIDVRNLPTGVFILEVGNISQKIIKK